MALADIRQNFTLPPRPSYYCYVLDRWFVMSKLLRPLKLTRPFEKLTVAQLVVNFLFVTQRFASVIIRVRYWSLTSARWIELDTIIIVYRCTMLFEDGAQTWYTRHVPSNKDRGAPIPGTWSPRRLKFRMVTSRVITYLLECLSLRKTMAPGRSATYQWGSHGITLATCHRSGS